MIPAWPPVIAVLIVSLLKLMLRLKLGVQGPAEVRESRLGGFVMTPVRLLIADDHEIVRRGLRTVLEARPGWEVVAEAGDGREALQRVVEFTPDVTILDISMPSMNGLEAARQIRKRVPESKILILSVHDSDPLIQKVLECGARGYLLKSDAARDLVTAVDALLCNKTFFTRRVEQVVLEGYLGKTPARGDNGKEIDALRLTARQR